MWQNNTSWKEGLFSEIPFKRFKAIWNKSQWDSPLALFTRLNTNDGYDLANLRLIGILLSSSPAMKPMNTLFTPDYYIVAIDTRLRTTDCSVEVKTQDGILGKARVTLEYQVSNPESLFSVDDPLFILKNRAGEAIQELISNKNYFSLDELNIENTLQVLEGKSETGISLKGFFNLQINWAESFTNRLENNVLDKLDDKTQRKLNRLKLDKLKDFGINDPILIASVLSQNDSDFEVIMNHVRSFSQAKKDEIERDINLLNWLKEKDFLTRADVQKVIDSLSAKSDDQQKQPTHLILIITQLAIRQLEIIVL
ncbi:MAG: hypothetical protein UZ14_CFX002001603 [Chloroflexi bacterium OLB14]|nr:MAG: hypothetical protein UZ14_CFX002001603 [Chloroflexi bacterium OLB14]